MNPILALAAKDLRILLRDKMAAFFVIGFPILYGAFFGMVMGGQGGGSKALKVAVADADQSAASQAFLRHLGESAAIETEVLARDQALDLVRRGKKTAFVAVPKGFGEHSFFSGRMPSLELAIDPARKAEAGMLEGLLHQAVFADVGRQFTDPKAMQEQLGRAKRSVQEASELSGAQKALFTAFFAALDSFSSGMASAKLPGASPFGGLELVTIPVLRDASNPATAYEVSFPSSISWALLSCLFAFAISIVKERTGGTFLRLVVSPLSSRQVLAGKGLACFATCFVVVALLLGIAALVFGVRISAPLKLLCALCANGVCFTGLMMLFANLGKSEEAVSGAGWAIMTVMAMVGGGMIPLIAMPPFMLAISDYSPVKWSILALEGAIWRQFSWGELAWPCGVLAAIGVVGFAIGARLLQRSR